MSDIKIEFAWWELILFSPVVGWPGIIVGSVIAALAWRKRPIVGGAIGAVTGNFLWALAAVYFM